MAIELYIFMENSRVPDRTAWQEAIERLGFPTQLDPTLDIRQDRGFTPAWYRGKETGFELYLDPIAGYLSALSTKAVSRIGRRNSCAAFRWGGDPDECAAAATAAAALVSLTNGLYYDPDEDRLWEAEEAVAILRRDLVPHP